MLETVPFFKLKWSDNLPVKTRLKDFKFLGFVMEQIYKNNSRKNCQDYFMTANLFFLFTVILMPCPSMWPKQFWLVQNDFGLTKLIWTWPWWFGHDQNEMVMTKMNWSGPNVINFGRKSWFGPDQFILVMIISFCLSIESTEKVQCAIILGV